MSKLEKLLDIVELIENSECTNVLLGAYAVRIRELESEAYRRVLHLVRYAHDLPNEAQGLYRSLLKEVLDLRGPVDTLDVSEVTKESIKEYLKGDVSLMTLKETVDLYNVTCKCGHIRWKHFNFSKCPDNCGICECENFEPIVDN